MALIIVESPTKVRTFNRILKGRDYFVFASFGHIRDLPSNKLSINYKNQFQPDYQIIPNKRKVVNELRRLAKSNTEIILATDLDREGESIAYHAAYVMGFIKENWPEFNIKRSIKDKLKRIVFHEITAKALEEALKNPQELRTNLVKAQQSRRILDRIVGYELSPLLWKTMGKNWLSAGRVQTVALRLVVEREKEIRKFKLEDYFQIYGEFSQIAPFKAKLISKEGVVFEEKITTQLFTGIYTYSKTSINQKNIEEIKSDLGNDHFHVFSIDESKEKRYPPPPLTTSLLQQNAFYKCGFSSKMTMRLAQDLYERGLITYHRTDSFNLSTNFVFKAQDYIKKEFGNQYALEKPRGYKTKSKMAQEAHEAIRPTKFEKEINSTGLTINHKRLYNIIFNRAIASQMKEAEINLIKIQILSDKKYLLITLIEQVVFDGFFRLLNPKFAKENKIKPNIKVNDSLDLKTLTPELLTTKPPPRFNEASLIRILEEKGIGRPSTYAAIISLIQLKNYTEKDGRYFVPTKLGEAVCDFLAESFPEIFNLDFTASMEDDLDKVAGGEKNFIDLLNIFYEPFKKRLVEKKDQKITIDVQDELDEVCPQCKSALVIRYSRFGKFIACSSYPKCKYTKSFLKTVKGKMCPKCAGEIVIRYSKNRKRFYGCSNYPKCKYSTWKL